MARRPGPASSRPARGGRGASRQVLRVLCLCGLQQGAVVGLKIGGDPGSLLEPQTYNVYCRAFDEGGVPIECPVAEVRATANISHRRHDAGSMPAEMLSQSCVDEVAHGSWGRSGRNFRTDSLGARKRYAGQAFYYGPPSSVDHAGADDKMAQIPHSRRWGWLVELESDTDIVWRPNAGGACPEYDWFQRDKASSCLANTWVAFWGDSTTRLLFSALVDFLGNGIEDPHFPSHDFTFQRHWMDHDHCSGGQCHLAVHFPDRNIVVTFDFIQASVRSYPDFWDRMKTNRNTFPEIHFQKDAPDVVLMNNGPWEYYNYGDSDWKWMGDDAYKQAFGDFLRGSFAGGGGGAQLPKLIVLKNTACTQKRGACEASSVSCVEAMDNVDRLQREVVSGLKETLLAGIRYLDGAYNRDLPPGYMCAGETSYHLPSVVSDLRINHALHALCH